MPKPKFEFSKKLEGEVSRYCQDLLATINPKFLSDNEIYKNEFLEFVFLEAKDSYEQTGKYELVEEDIVSLLYLKQQADQIIKELKEKRAVFTGINKEGQMIFEFNTPDILEQFNNSLKQKIDYD